jgi:multiple sugar transport system permease protein
MAVTVLAPSPTATQPATAPRKAKRGKDRVASIALHTVLIAGLLVMISPFLWTLLSAFKPDGEIRTVPPTWWPQHPTLGNFRELFERLDFPLYFTNSALVALVVTAGNLLICSATAYALAKLPFPGRRALFAIVVGNVMVPVMVTFVPTFVLVSRLGLVNTYAGLILPNIALAVNVFLIRQYMLSLPDELLESARIDGAGEWRIFWRIVLPLCRPVLATVGILTFLGSWNNFLWPLVVATTEDHYTLPVALALYSVGQNQTQYGLLLAGSVVVITPIVVVFFLLQKHFVQGIATTGMKS